MNALCGFGPFIRSLFLIFSVLFSLAGRLSGFPLWDQIEIPEKKSFRKDLLLFSKKNDPAPVPDKMIRDGLATASFRVYSGKDFHKKNRNLLPGVSDREAFASGVVVMLSGNFLIPAKNREFFSPGFQLQKEVVEGIGRKVFWEGKAKEGWINARKIIKSDRIRKPGLTYEGVPGLGIPFRMGSLVYHKHSKEAQWQGISDYRFDPGLLEELDRPCLEYFKGANLSHIVTTFTEPKNKNDLIQGAHFVMAFYTVPGKPWLLVTSRWFTGINRKELLSQIAGKRIGSFFNSILQIIGMPGVHSLIKNTVLRDYARFIDFLRPHLR